MNFSLWCRTYSNTSPVCVCVYVCPPEPSLAFTHSPGSMFITDLPDPSSSDPPTTPQLDQSPLTFLISQQPLLYSMAAGAAVQRIRTLERLIGEDPGNPSTTPQLLPLLPVSLIIL